MHRLDMTAAGRIALALCLWVALAGRSEASPYYTATYVGPGGIQNIGIGTDSVTNYATGLSYAFVTTTTPVTSADQQNLPSDSLQSHSDNVAGLPPVQYTMHVSAINSSGTAIGSLPSGQFSNPWDQPVYGYTVRSSNGQYSPFMTLVLANPGGPNFANLTLSQSNQILINNAFPGGGTLLYNVNTGISTQMSQIVPAALFQEFHGAFYGSGIDNRGDILAYVGFGSPTGSYYILTPPGLAPPDPIPTATPEPSTLAFFGLIAGSLAVRSALGRRGKRRGRSDVSHDQSFDD